MTGLAPVQGNAAESVGIPSSAVEESELASDDLSVGCAHPDKIESLRQASDGSQGAFSHSIVPYVFYALQIIVLLVVLSFDDSDKAKSKRRKNNQDFGD